MPSYICSICIYTTNKKSNYLKHIKSNKHANRVCVIGEPSIGIQSQQLPNQSPLSQPVCSQKKPAYLCDDCGQEFAQKNNYYRHRKHYCKGNDSNQMVKSGSKSETLSMKDNIQDIWRKDIDQLFVASNTNNVLTNSQNTTNNTTTNTNSHNNNNNVNSNNTNSNNNVQQNIVVNNFGKDNWDHMTDEIKINLLKNPHKMIKLAFEKVNLNEDVPENHNIRVENKRSDKVLIWEDEMWRNMDKDNTLRVVVDEKYYELDSFFRELKTNNPERLRQLMSECEINAYTKFSKKFDDETNAQNVNHPDRQPLNNGFSEDCFYSLVDEMLNSRIKRRNEKEK